MSQGECCYIRMTSKPMMSANPRRIDGADSKKNPSMESPVTLSGLGGLVYFPIRERDKKEVLRN